MFISVYDVIRRMPQLLEIAKISPFWIGSLLLSLHLIYLGYWTYHMENRKIAFDEFGFTLVDQRIQTHSWGDVHSIGIVMFAANASKQHYQNTICL